MGVRGAKRHLKRLNAPKHWMLDKMGGVWAPKPSAGPHKSRECVPIIVLLRNRLKYALTYQEAKMIVKQRLVSVDGKPRTEMRYPAGFMGARRRRSSTRRRAARPAGPAPARVWRTVARGAGRIAHARRTPPRLRTAVSRARAGARHASPCSPRIPLHATSRARAARPAHPSRGARRCGLARQDQRALPPALRRARALRDPPHPGGGGQVQALQGEGLRARRQEGPVRGDARRPHDPLPGSRHLQGAARRRARAPPAALRGLLARSARCAPALRRHPLVAPALQRRAH